MYCSHTLYTHMVSTDGSMFYNGPQEGPTFLQLLTGYRELQLLQCVHSGPSVANLSAGGVRKYDVPTQEKCLLIHFLYYRRRVR